MKITDQSPSPIVAIAMAMLASTFGSPLVAAELSEQEIGQIESDLGITLSAEQKNQLAMIVKPEGASPLWRLDAEARIQQHRTANLTVRVVDSLGRPVTGATVQADLLDNSFRFGGVLDVRDFNDDSARLEISTARYKELFLKLFNAAGLNNGLKIKQRAVNEQFLPDFFDWAQANDLPVRGHTLIWPGTPQSNHMPFSNPNILGDVEAVESAIANGEDSATILSLKETLRLNIRAMISEWASTWPVYEWDVINEPITNHRVQDLIGYEQMAEWFKVASENAVLPACNFVLNEYQIISARSESLDPDYYAERAAAHKDNIDIILANGGPLNRLGFQSRFKFEHPDPAVLYSRLEDFSKQYGFVMVGTEFEVRDNDNPNYFPTDFDEFERAQITEEVLTTYYSHPMVDGLFAWTYMKPDEFSMCYYDGTIKLNALVWYYLHRIRYATSKTLITSGDGSVEVSGYKGRYGLKVNIAGSEYATEAILTEDRTLEIRLDEPVSYWGAYPVDPEIWVNTDAWLGWLQVQNTPWAWSEDFGKWLYFPIQPQGNSGSWVYIAKS